MTDLHDAVEISDSGNDEIGSQNNKGEPGKESFAEEIVYNNKPRRKMQREPDFRSTLERLQSCKSVRDALDILQQITDAKMDLVIPATREDIDLIVREFEERLRRGENPSDVDLSSEIQEELKRFLDSFSLPEHKDGPKEDGISRQLSRQISEEKEKEMKIIASRLGRTFLNNTSSEENSGEGITAVKIKGGETVSETDIKFGSLVEPLDPVPTASADLVFVAPKETFKVETAAEGTTNEKEFLDLQQPKSKICIFSDREQFEHYIKSHIDPNAFSWRIIEGVAEFVVLSLHVLFGPDRIKEIQNEGGDVENLKHLDVCRQLYQNIPVVGECKCGVYCLYNRKKVGETKRALYKQGEQGDYSAAIMDRSGIEIALVKMEYEEEVSIDFADWIADQWNKLGMGNQLVFKGNCQNYHDIPLGTKVYKMGPKTGLTEGVITKKNETYKFLNGVLLLFNQVVVQWENVPFSKPKDSGSMVFSVEKGEMISIGIVTGSKREKKLSIVTPISEIMEYISEKNRGKFYRLKRFMLKMDGEKLRKIITDKIIKTMPPRS